MEMFFFRGVDCRTDEENGGKILAKGDAEQLVFFAGDSTVMIGNELNTIDASSRNAMHGHNICSDQYKTTYVSFTTDRLTAEKFATNSGRMDGYVYVICAKALSELGISYSFQEAQVNNHEFEVLVNLAGFDSLPHAAIIEKLSIAV
ncbi:hypothetical protein [Pseudomonas orientalis]|uniref:Uncharacterized protein n=1 Tax=Pseudomonas orientalis TaxID=76758 RepID=A0A2L0RWV5_9PSED|nr:hypothetical protein [Pseudomonas orientalis]AUZ46583.1 hypothetical protein BOP93_13605 [Pseudomonas orientalis]